MKIGMLFAMRSEFSAMPGAGDFPLLETVADIPVYEVVPDILACIGGVSKVNAAMGGVDAIIFTAGVGENSASQRLAIASGLEFMGVKMDAEANNVRGKEVEISAADSKVKVLLIPTNEELMIAMDTAAIVSGK